LGTSGCGWEQHLKALERAVITNHDANNGFLRPSSHLVIIIFTTEDDCSVSAGNEYIHDTFDGEFGEYNLRCMNYPHLITSVDDHIDFIDSLRHLPNHMTMLLVAGVPTGDTCEGYGNEIDGCLTDPAMIETINPEHPSALLPSCESPSRGAMPARRLVELAQHFGNAAIVQSICHDDYSVGMELLLDRTQEMISLE
jgi:hypothetical protein